MSPSLRKSSFIPNLASIGFFILALPVGIAIIVAIWLTAAAAYENVKFVRCTDQLLTIIGMIHDDAASDAEFGTRANEDLINDLLRRAQLLSQPINDWSGAVRAVMLNPSYMRIETDIPVRACRRLALFFGKDANALKLARMDAREENGTAITIYSSDKPSPTSFDYRTINAACGMGSYSTFGLIIPLR